jgi:hypothetical protein
MKKIELGGGERVWLNYYLKVPVTNPDRIDAACFALFISS